MRSGGVFPALRAACSGVGGPDVLERVQWLAARFGLTADEVAEALCDACAGGDLHRARWLAARLMSGAGAPPVAILATLRDAWARARAGGHLEVARWLAARFGQLA